MQQSHPRDLKVILEIKNPLGTDSQERHFYSITSFLTHIKIFLPVILTQKIAAARRSCCITTRSRPGFKELKASKGKNDNLQWCSESPILSTKLKSQTIPLCLYFIPVESGTLRVNINTRIYCQSEKLSDTETRDVPSASLLPLRCSSHATCQWSQGISFDASHFLQILKHEHLLRKTSIFTSTDWTQKRDYQDNTVPYALEQHFQRHVRLVTSPAHVPRGGRHPKSLLQGADTRHVMHLQ